MTAFDANFKLMPKSSGSGIIYEYTHTHQRE